MTATRYRPWELYSLHLEALVWSMPVRVGDNRALRHILADALYSWSRVGLVDHDADPWIYQYRDGQAIAFRSLFAYASGYTESGSAL